MNRSLCLALTMLLGACGERTAMRPSPEVTFSKGRLLFRKELFTGVLEERFDVVGTVRRTHYRGGIVDGLQEERLQEGGQVVARGEWKAGKKVGVHEGWFPDGQRRFHYEYADGEYHGEVWEWYRSGAVSQFARFEHGRALGKKMWREDGQIYMNWVFLPDRAVGVPGSKLCYQVRGDSAEAERPRSR